MQWDMLQSLAVFLLFGGAQAHSCQAEDTCLSSCEDDAFPLLQMPRQNASAPNASRDHAAVHPSPALRALHGALPKKSNSTWNSDTERTMLHKEEEQLPFFGPTALPLNGTLNGKIITRRMREKQLGREAVSAAALIMLLISFSVGLQLIMVEFVMTGTCAIPQSIAGVVLAVIVTITHGLRYFVRFLTAPLRRPCRYFWNCCCAWRNRGKVSAIPITQALPELVMEQVVSFADLETMCELGCVSDTFKDLVNRDSCSEALMKEVANFGLEHRWIRHLQRVKMPMSETDSSSGQDTSEEAATRSEEVAPVQEVPEVPEEVPKGTSSPGDSEAKVPKMNLIRELRVFLCRQARRSKAKAEEKELNERWEVLTDVVRYCMLVVGWFWFSAEVMDMACLEGGGVWQVVKAVSSPIIFIFILESDRHQFWWQVVAGIVAATLLLDLLFG